MYDLTAFTLEDMTTCGAALRQLGAGAASMEEAANRTVRYIYEHFVDADGQLATALVRFFITMPYRDLNTDLRQHVDLFLGCPPDDLNLKCQTLLATIGDNPAWHSRLNSRYYKVHPLTARIVDVNPMFAQVSEMFGIVLEKAITRDPDLLLDLERQTYNIFHVPDALGNEYIPDQADFVVPYGIRSVLGFYGLLPSGNLFTVIIFAKVAITRDMTAYFRPLALNVKTAILPFDATAVFTADSSFPQPPSQDLAHLRSQAASLSQLLDVHEQVVVEQSAKIAQVVTELEGQIAENARLRQQAEEAAVTAERHRLARDLHDSVTQALYTQTLYAEAAARQLAQGETAVVADHLQQLRQTARQALREMRLLIFELRPPALADDGLAAALQARLEAVEARTGMTTAVTFDPAVQLAPDVETGLYWIAQEALNNTLKHAQASNIAIDLSQEAPGLRLSIRDNGVGFASAAAPTGLGLRGMHERAAKLGWQLTITSAPGQGTTILVEVPQ